MGDTLSDETQQRKVNQKEHLIYGENRKNFFIRRILADHFKSPKFLVAFGLPNSYEKG